LVFNDPFSNQVFIGSNDVKTIEDELESLRRLRGLPEDRHFMP